MIIDFHAHIFPDTLAPRAVRSLKDGAGDFFTPTHNMTLTGLLDYMDKSEIDKSVVLPVVTKRTQTETVNNWVSSINNPRIIPFGGMYPMSDDYKEQIDMIVSLGLKGVKFHAEFQHFTLDDPHMMHVYDYAFEKGLIIIHHAGSDPAFDPPFHSNPSMFAKVAKELKGGILIAAHLGGLFQWEEVLEELAGTDIYFDTSMAEKYGNEELVEAIYKKHGADKLLFGTDSPWSNSATAVKKMRERNFSDEELEKIFHGNAERLLGL